MSVNFGSRGSGRPGPPRSVLLVIPDALLRDLLAHTLRGAGWFPLPAASVEEGRRIASQVVPDAIVLDIDRIARADLQPAEHGVRGVALDTVPLLALSSSLQDAAGLGVPGESASLAKPVNPSALMERLRQLIAGRAAPPPVAAAVGNPPLVLPGLEVDRDAPTLRRRVGRRWQARDLSPLEHRMLVTLLQAHPRVLSREELRQAVWGGDPVTLRSVDQYVKRLRVALSDCGLRELIGTCRGAGYRVEMSALGSGE